MQKLLIRIVNGRLQKLCICLTSQKDWVKRVILSVNYQNIFIVHDFNDNKSYLEIICLRVLWVFLNIQHGHIHSLLIN